MIRIGAMMKGSLKKRSRQPSAITCLKPPRTHGTQIGIKDSGSGERTGSEQGWNKQLETAVLLSECLVSALTLQRQVRMDGQIDGVNRDRVSELGARISAAANWYVNLISRRVGELGGSASRIAEVTRGSSDMPEQLVAVSDGLESTAIVLGQFRRIVGAAMDGVKDGGDGETADLFDEIARDLDHWLWFSAAYAGVLPPIKSIESR